MAYETGSKYETVPSKMADAAPTDLSLAGALSDLREVAAEAAKAAEDYLVARDRWQQTRQRLDDVQARVGALREQADR